MCGEVLVALLITGVLWDVVEVFAADDDGSVHLCGLRDCVRGYVLPDPRELSKLTITLPDKIRPRMETRPVNGHFLSM